jgi:hypothetical protein
MNKIRWFLYFFNTKKGSQLAVSGIVTLNILIYLLSSVASVPGCQSRKDATGFSFKDASEFIYFYYYTGDFPLGTLNKDLVYSAEGAKNEIEHRGEDLIMEYNHWSRLGEHARIFAFLPHAYLYGSPEKPSIKLFNALVFALSLIILFLGLYYLKKGGIGVLLVLIINLTPFFLHEVYARENIFGLLGSTFFIVLGANISAIIGEKQQVLKRVIIAVLCSLLIGFFSEIRNEISIVLLPLLLIYVFSGHYNLLKKIAITALLFVSFNAAKQSVRQYYNAKFEQTTNLVEQQNGHVYNGKRISGHKVWHPVFCGLGDFGEKYGYAWNDKVAYRYAVPILNQRYGLGIKYSGEYYTDNYYDTDSLYYVKFDEIQVYDDVVKEKVLHDIKNDPLWYGGIIMQRIIQVLTTTIPLPYIGWLVIPLFYFLIKKRDWKKMFLLIVSLPLSITSIVVYSGGESTYNSVYVYVMLLIGLLYLEKYFSNKATWLSNTSKQRI